MRYTPEAQLVSIVVIGNFNPAIFSPAWLRLHDVISDDELAVASIKIAHPGISDFDIDTLNIQVTSERFSAIITSIPSVRVADLVEIVFGSLLRHTPVRQVGINYQLHFNLDVAARRTALGRKLAPLSPWGAWGEALDQEDLRRTGGLRSLTMEEVVPDGRKTGGYRRVTIEPSTLKSSLQQAGVFMSINDHHELHTDATTTEFLISVLRDEFDRSLEASRAIVSDMMSLAESISI